MTGDDDRAREARFVMRRAAALTALAVILFSLGVSPHWRISPDSALYIGLARSISHGGGYTFSGDVQPSVPPLAPRYYSLAWRAGEEVAGKKLPPEEAVFALNTAAAAAAIAGVLAAFLLALEMGSQRRALIVLLLVVASRRYFEGGIVPLTDVPYAALSWGALVFVLRARREGGMANRFAAAAFLTAAVATRFVGVTLIAAAGGAFLRDLAAERSSRKRAAANLAAVLPAIIVAALLFLGMTAGKGAGSFNYLDDAEGRYAAMGMVKTLAVNLVNAPGYLFETIFAVESIAGLGFVAAAVVIVGFVAARRRTTLLGAAYVILYVGMVASLYEVLPRYFMPLLPIVIVAGLDGIDRVGGAMKARFARLPGALAPEKVTAVVVGIAAAINCFYIGREIALNFSDDFYGAYRHGYYADYVEAADVIRDRRIFGRVLAYRSRITHVLGLAPTAPLPWNPSGAARPSDAELAEYIRASSVQMIIVDPDDAESAERFSALISERAEEWQLRAEVGRLLLFDRTTRASRAAN